MTRYYDDDDDDGLEDGQVSFCSHGNNGCYQVWYNVDIIL